MKILIISLLLLSTICTKAQDCYLFRNLACNLPEIKSELDEDELGKSIAIKLNQFNHVYTKRINCGPPGYIISTEIQKPDLYFSIQKLSKYYRKCLKKQKLTQIIIESEMLDILNKCLLIYSQETKLLEQDLRAANNSKDIIRVFNKIIIE